MTMFWLLLACLVLVCTMIILVLFVQLCWMWSGAAERRKERGLTAAELKKLEEGKMAVGGGGECAVCLEEMEVSLEEMAESQAVRVLPGCCHAFHRHCADAWLKIHSVCPLCRVRLLPLLSLPPSQPQPQSPPS